MADARSTRIPGGTLLTRILLGANALQTATQLQTNKQVAAVQDLGPEHVNTARVLLVVMPNTIDAREAALTALKNACAPSQTIVLNDDYTTYGLPDFGSQTITATQV